MRSNNVRALRDFYQRVLKAEAEGESVFVTLKTEGAEFSIFSTEGFEEMAPGCMIGAGAGGYTIEFEVHDIDQEHTRLTAMNVPIVKPPTTQPWGRRSFWFRDPDENIVNFYVDAKPDCE